MIIPFTITSARLFLLLTAFFSAPFAVAEPENIPLKEIVIAADEWCPYNCTPNSELPGYMVEIAREALALAAPNQYQLTYIQLPWKRAMLMAKEGAQVHGIIGAIASEAEGLYTPKEEQGLMYARFFVKDDNPWQYFNTKQLLDEKIRLGAIDGYDYEASIAKFISENPQQVYLSIGDPALPKLVQLLNLNRIDALIEDQAVFWYNIKTLGFKASSYRVAGRVDAPEKLYLAFHSKKIADIVSKGTMMLRETGALERIIQKYNLTDWKK